jgi:hypothetical protein
MDQLELAPSNAQAMRISAMQGGAVRLALRFVQRGGKITGAPQHLARTLSQAGIFAANRPSAETGL